MHLRRTSVLNKVKPEFPWDITSHELQACLMAAQGLASAEIIDAFWSEIEATLTDEARGR